jgi:hypothetical protein
VPPGHLVWHVEAHPTAPVAQSRRLMHHSCSSRPCRHCRLGTGSHPDRHSSRHMGACKPISHSRVAISRRISHQTRPWQHTHHPGILPTNARLRRSNPTPLAYTARDPRHLLTPLEPHADCFESSSPSTRPHHPLASIVTNNATSTCT